MGKSKTYSANVFSHKKGVWGGMDNSKGELYRGDTIQMSLNVVTDENVFKPREGFTEYASTDSGILSAKSTLRYVLVSTGSKVFYDTVVPTFAKSPPALRVSMQVGVSISGYFQEADLLNVSVDVKGQFGVLDEGVSMGVDVEGVYGEPVEALTMSVGIEGTFT